MYVHTHGETETGIYQCQHHIVHVGLCILSRLFFLQTSRHTHTHTHATKTYLARTLFFIKGFVPIEYGTHIYIYIYSYVPMSP